MILVWDGKALIASDISDDERVGIEHCFKLSSAFLQDYLSKFLLDRAKQAKAVERHNLFQAFSALPDDDKIMVTQLINKGKS